MSRHPTDFEQAIGRALGTAPQSQSAMIDCVRALAEGHRAASTAPDLVKLRSDQYGRLGAISVPAGSAMRAVVFPVEVLHRAVYRADGERTRIVYQGREWLVAVPYRELMTAIGWYEPKEPIVCTSEEGEKE